MKKFNALLSLTLMVLLSLPAVGQVMNQAQIDNATLMQRSNIELTNQKIRTNSYQRVEKDAASRANTSFMIDHDSLNNNDAAFFWTLNKNFTGGGEMTYALVTFDSLVDLAGTGYNYDQHTVLIDSIDILLSHRNGSGQEDTVIVSVIELDPVTNFWTQNVLWSDSIFASTSLTGAINSFALATFTPNYAVCQGRFGVRIDFFGPVTDTLGIIASFFEGPCATQMCSNGGPGAQRLSNFWPSSYYGYNNGPNNVIEIPTAGGGDLFRDCNGDMMVTAGGCEAWFVQDFWFWPHVTITDTPPAAISVDSKTQTPDDGSGNGTASISVSGGLGDLRVTWGTIPPQFGTTATGLAAGKYPFFVTYGSNCDAIVDTVEVLSMGGMSIDDLNAGISSLKAFPNPNNGQFNLTFEMEKADDVRVKVYDLTGKVVYSEMNENVRNFNGKIDLGNAVNGIYFIRIETSLGTTTRRIVKQ